MCVTCKCYVLFRTPVFPVFCMSKTLTFFSWNVRGLGQTCRCGDVLTELLSARPSIIALQETKLQSLNTIKRSSFLPSRLSSCVTRDSSGAAGGILTAWDASLCDIVDVSALPFSLTSSFTLRADDTRFTLTNVYSGQG